MKLDIRDHAFLNIDVVVTSPAHGPTEPDLLFFSGGIAELMSRIDQQLPIQDRFDDTGLLLAEALIHAPSIQKIPIQFPADPIRATVIGAGQFSTSLSGETLFIDPAILPLTNIPIIRPARFLNELGSPKSWADAINRQRRLHDVPANQTVAICLPSLLNADWHQIETLAQSLSQAARTAPLPTPWLFVMADNFGKLLGEKISQAAPDRPTLVIDEINLSDADFIDLGRPVEKQRPVIPVVAKSLIFK